MRRAGGDGPWLRARSAALPGPAGKAATRSGDGSGDSWGDSALCRPRGGGGGGGRGRPVPLLLRPRDGPCAARPRAAGGAPGRGREALPPRGDGCFQPDRAAPRDVRVHWCCGAPRPLQSGVRRRAGPGSAQTQRRGMAGTVNGPGCFRAARRKGRFVATRSFGHVEEGAAPQSAEPRCLRGPRPPASQRVTDIPARPSR